MGKALPRRSAARCVRTKNGGKPRPLRESTVQKMNFPENQKVRWPGRLPASLENCGPLAVEVITPKFELDILVCGLPKFGVLVPANPVTRNWTFTPPVLGKFG